jgi:hypothetical protein
LESFQEWLCARTGFDGLHLWLKWCVILRVKTSHQVAGQNQAIWMRPKSCFRRSRRLMRPSVMGGEELETTITA